MQTHTNINVVHQQPKLSIIVPTIGRIIEVEQLLYSLISVRESEKYEILIIDQNKEIVLDSVLSQFPTLNIKHHKVNFTGLSKAKNYGVLHATGGLVCFPDDDCKLFEDTFEKAITLIEEKNLDIAFGKCVDEEGKDSVLIFQKEPYFLNKKNMLGGFVEATVVCKRDIFDDFLFDEKMGAGCFFGAEEGFDWLYRILTQSNLKVYYTPLIRFYHPQVILSKGDQSSLNRVFKYRCGTAYLCVKHKFTGKYYRRLFLAKIASLLFLLKNRRIATYYNTEYLALKIGRIFAKQTNNE